MYIQRESRSMLLPSTFYRIVRHCLSQNLGHLGCQTIGLYDKPASTSFGPGTEVRLLSDPTGNKNRRSPLYLLFKR